MEGKKKKKPVRSVPQVFVAPPSPVGTIVSATSQLPSGLAQGQADLVALQDMLDNWPADAPASLQPLAEILERVVQDLMTVAQTTGVMAQISGVI